MRTINIKALLCFLIMNLVACSESENTEKQVSVSSEKKVESADEGERPNVLLIVVDDLGFNDLGINGSEIQTPNIDQLIRDGISFTNFHVSPTCSPTRSMLLSGTDNHIAGLGNMAWYMADNQRGQPGYEGHLNFRVAALPELFQDAGYNTYMTGKWHLGLTEETSPSARGFDKSLSLAQGGAGHFSNMLQIFGENKAIYREDGNKLESLPDDFYSTQFYTERMIDYIDSNLENKKPFFAYLAYSALHWPLQAPQKSIAKYKGVYDEGYEVLRARRLQAHKDRGFVAEDVVPFPRYTDEPNWNSLNDDEKSISPSEWRSMRRCLTMSMFI